MGNLMKRRVFFKCFSALFMLACFRTGCGEQEQRPGREMKEEPTISFIYCGNG